MRKLLNNKHGDLSMIFTAVIAAIMFAISLIVVFNILGAVDGSSIDARFNTTQDRNDSVETPAQNATTDLQTNIETFYTVGPIVLIVIAAVGILGYVMLLRKKT